MNITSVISWTNSSARVMCRTS